MSITIEQKPAKRLIPANARTIFVVKDGFAVANKVKVKYIAEVYIEKTSGDISTSITNGTFRSKLKVSPNDAGVGIFDFGPIIGNYVSPEYLGGDVHNSNATNGSAYNGVQYSVTAPHNIHQVDKYSTNRTSCRYLKIKFKVEFAANITSPVQEDTGNDVESDEFIMYNGYLDNTDILKLGSGSMGNIRYDLDYANLIMNDSSGRFLTNAPIDKQYADVNDYMTMAFFDQYEEDYIVGGAGTHPSIKKIVLVFYYNGSQVSTITRTKSGANGGHYGHMTDSNTKMQFIGCGPGNIIGAGGSLPANWDYYTIIAYNDLDQVISNTYYIYYQAADCKYGSTRLTWLNKYGAWDYYNFQKKSVKSFAADRVTYTQLEGSWNEERFIPHGHLGGKKAYKNNITENITLNTDFITEDEAIWLEELFISTDVFVINPRSADDGNQGYLRKYIEPITISSGEHIRKSSVNDKLVQYTFEITKTLNRQTQRV